MVGNESAIADTYHHLGVVAHAQKRYGEAEGWYQKALEILVRRGDEVVAANTWGQLGLLADQRRNYPHAVWYVAHIYEIAAAHQLPLLEQARKHLSGLRAKMGTEAFTRSWQEVSDVNVLPELE
jgi:tetratricopeptide (TPR) repeat protein